MMLYHAITVYIDERTLLKFLLSQSDNRYLRPSFIGIPKDANIDRIWYDPPRKAFGVNIGHPSFPEVECNGLPEIREVEWEMVDINGVHGKPMVYKGYLAEVEWDAEKRIYYGHAVGIRDKITFCATGLEQIEEEFQKSVETYLEFCQELGEMPESPKGLGAPFLPPRRSIT